VHQITDKLKTLYRQWSGVEPETYKAIAVSGSERKYYRLCSNGKSAIGVWNGEKEENLAFLYFTGHFQKYGLRVATVYAVDPGMQAYLLEDLGDVSLFSMLENNKSKDSFPLEVEKLYRESLKGLIRFQVVAGKDLDYSYCYPHAAFDQRSMKWDLNYFKYYFLKPNVQFHEGRLEDDFETLTAYLGKADAGYFMYRDFQARNIMVHDGKPCFIDYQGGRKGPLQYDVASLLFQVKADLPYDKREELLDFYITELSGSVGIDRKIFREHYYGFVLIRLIQVLGAYGFRGVIERKPHFLASIPFALKNLEWWLNHDILPLNLPELRKSLQALIKIEKYQQTIPVSVPGKLTVMISSFSYRHGFPEDMSGNGGGFVFDCRALPNPGREERYRAFNGTDQVIIDYLKDVPAVINFLGEAEKLVCSSIENYLQRGFSSLSVNFGCTGGQHRSVFCAETLAGRLRERFGEVNFKVKHLMVRG
jgi:aminoglycoside/choline kinase family phosphotransferase